MKEIYTKPEIKIVEFQTENIMQTSGISAPTDVINNSTAQSLGAIKYVDIFTNE